MLLFLRPAPAPAPAPLLDQARHHRLPRSPDLELDLELESSPRLKLNHLHQNENLLLPLRFHLKLFNSRPSFPSTPTLSSSHPWNTPSAPSIPETPSRKVMSRPECKSSTATH